MNSLAQQAINEALRCNWEKAIEINKEILKSSSTDVDAMNRLARAYAETRQITKAKKLAHNVLKIDPFNQIAQKSLVRWNKSEKDHIIRSNEPIAGPTTFLEEPGKTKIVNLINLGSVNILESLNTADEVKISAHSHKVCVTTLDGKYVGKLPDDLSARLRTLIKGGNIYSVFVKSIEKDSLKVFIREVRKSSDFTDTPSFPTERIDYVSYAPPELVSSEKPFKDAFEEETL